MGVGSMATTMNQRPAGTGIPRSRDVGGAGTPCLGGYPRLRRWHTVPRMTTGVVQARQTVDAVERICADATSADEMLEGLAGELQRAVPLRRRRVVRHRPGDTPRIGAQPGGEPRRPAVLDVLAPRVPRAGLRQLRRPRARRRGVSPPPVARRPPGPQHPLPRVHGCPRASRTSCAAVFRVGDSIWGFIDFYRESATQPFGAEDVALVKSVTQHHRRPRCATTSARRTRGWASRRPPACW